MFVHYDFMKKKLQGSSLESDSGVFQLRMGDFSVLWEIERLSWGTELMGFRCINVLFKCTDKAKCYLEGKGAGIIMI